METGKKIVLECSIGIGEDTSLEDVLAKSATYLKLFIGCVYVQAYRSGKELAAALVNEKASIAFYQMNDLLTMLAGFDEYYAELDAEEGCGFRDLGRTKVAPLAEELAKLDELVNFADEVRADG